jgi:DNA mismatch endonuclease (patch repair protein)
MRKQFNNYQGRNFNKHRTSDTISKAQRSNLMSRIKSKNTKFEADFIKQLKRIVKAKCHQNASFIKGKPDIVFMKQRLCVFLDSDFWHGWQFPRWKHLLKNEFWRDKILSNRKRDKRTTRYLRGRGWIVIRLWEHEIKKQKYARGILDKINRLL